MKTILATAYSLNPYKGSEDSMGWNYALQVSKYNKVIVITRENNRTSIEKYLSENLIASASNLNFEYFDLPNWMRFWKKGSRGVILYYYLWQFFIPKFVKKRQLNFDIVHNLNFHNDWAPSFLWKLNKPFIWGPIGHHPVIPIKYILPFYGWKYFIQDRFTFFIKNMFWLLDPFLKKTRIKVSKIWVMHTESANKIKKYKHKLFIAPSIASDDMGNGKNNLKLNENFNIISVGRFVPLKGFDITINAFASFLMHLPQVERKKIKLTIVGTGPTKSLLKKLILKKGIENYVEIIEWVPRDQLKKLYHQSSLFLFPSHEGAGMVVAEALSCSLPVICLNNCGPGTFINETCGVKVDYSTYSETIEKIGQSLLSIYYNETKLKQLTMGARKQFENVFAWNNKGEILKKIYDETI